MIMALPKIISILAPKIFKVIKNLKSKDGGEGKLNVKLLGQDVAIDLFRVGLFIVVLLAVFGVVDWETVEKASEYFGL